MMSTYVTRTVMVAVGNEGARVLVAARRRLDERMGDGLPIGIVVLADEVPSGVAALPLDCELEALTGTVMAVLREISGIRVSRSSAVDVIFVSTPTESGPQLARVSEQVLRMIGERLGGEGRVMNLLLLPDPLANGVTLPVPHKAHEMIRRLSHPCLLLSAVNREGFRLADRREEFAAEILVQLSATPLGDGLWQFAGEHGCVAVGLAALVYSAESQSRFSVRLAQEMATCWVGGSVAQEGSLAEAEAFVLNHSLDPHQVIDQVMGTGLAMNENQLEALEAEFELIEDRLSERLEQTRSVQLQADLEELVSKEVVVFEQRLEEQLKKWLGSPTDYTLRDVSSFCLALQTTLKQRADFSQQRAEHCYRRLSALDDQKTSLLESLSQKSDGVGEDGKGMFLSIREWLAMIVRQILRSREWLRDGVYERKQQVYRTTVTEHLRLTRQLLRYDLENRYLAHAQRALVPYLNQVTAFYEALMQASESLAASQVHTGNHLFELEWSLDKHLNHEALAATYVPSPKRALASIARPPFLRLGDGARGRGGDGWADEIAKELERVAREQLGAFTEVGLSELLEAFVPPEVREKLLLSLVAAAVPFSGTVSADYAHREKVLLGVPSRTVGTLEALLAKSQSPVQVVPGGEAKRMTALRLMRIEIGDW